MTLTEIAPGGSVYIDANIFIYHFAARSPECSTFLARVERGEIRGFVGPTGIIEVAHRLMMLEAIERGLAVRPNPGAHLARQPQIVRQLSRYYFSALKIPSMGVEMLPFPSDFITASQEFRQSHGLLVNDSLIPMHMRQAGLSALASADAAFDGISGIQRYSPSDV